MNGIASGYTIIKKNTIGNPVMTIPHIDAGGPPKYFLHV